MPVSSKVHLLTVLGLAGVGLGGCSPKEVECGSADAQAVVGSIVLEQIRKAASSAGTDEEGAARLSLSKLRATADQLKISLTDVRTSRTDPNSTKRFCAATLKLVVPVAVMDDADRAREVVQLPSVTATADNLGIEYSANRFEVPVEYNVQPTDEGDQVFADVEGVDAVADLFGQVIASAVSRTRLEDGQRLVQAQEVQQKASAAAAMAEGQKLALESAEADSKLAMQSLNTLWGQLPRPSRSQLLEAQRTWVRKKEADCQLVAAQTSIVVGEAEAARLTCDARMTRERYAYLEQFRASEAPPAQVSDPTRSPKSEAVGAVDDL